MNGSLLVQPRHSNNLVLRSRRA
uniref:Uncharacterized protein n=1 Tax=Rhizophora mucronata TaxID=61149 RepID=A0A2P2KDD6_RHIMU